MKNLISLYVIGICIILSACSDSNITERAEEIAKVGEQAIQEIEDQYGMGGDDLLPEASNTNVLVNFSGYSDQSFDKVYRYQANVADSSAFIWMTFDNNDMDDQHIAVTLDLAISGEGEYILDRQKNGNIYIEIDGLAFRTDARNGTVNITSASGEYFEGTFSAENVARNQNMGDEIINITEARFKLPLNDMRRNQ